MSVIAEEAEMSVGDNQKKPRNRIRFSCTRCREKKLKCNRILPCDQCVKRGSAAACVYIPYLVPRVAPTRRGGNVGISGIGERRTPPTPPEATLRGRLQHLENLVQALRTRQGPAADLLSAQTQEQVAKDGEQQPSTDELVCENFAETAGSIAGDLRYVGEANWEAVLDEIASLAKELRVDGEPDEDDQDDADAPEADQWEGPLLLHGTFESASMADMLVYLPHRTVMDRLIARFFQGKEPGWMIFHVPVFLREYESFWDSPETSSLTWLGLLFAMISHAALFCMRGDEEVPGNMGTSLEVFEVYRFHSARCLVLDNYTQPGKYKIEAMLLYYGTEYLRSADAQRATSIIFTIIVRLAVQMGFHRDPRHYPEISPFEGEMRRRTWALLCDVDALVSFQFGLPANIIAQFCDTELPRNLFDEDFDESSQELPPPRPLTERTPTLYYAAKNSLVAVFHEVLVVITSTKPTPYGELLRINERLEAAHDSFPPILRYRPFSQSIPDPIDLIMQRYWLELLYQKARTVLHRKYHVIARFSAVYAHSRWTCMDAAVKTHRHQYDIHNEIQPGGRLSKERWFLSSLSTHDFLLANMMLCLELMWMNRQESTTTRQASSNTAPSVLKSDGDRPAVDNSKPIIPKEQLLEILRTSRSVWEASRAVSAEANRAFKILSRMLSISTGSVYETSPGSSEGSSGIDIGTGAPQKQSAVSNSALSGFPIGHIGLTGISQPSGQQFTPVSGTSTASWAPPSMGLTSPNMQLASPWATGLPMFETPNEAALIDHHEDLVDPSLGPDWSLWDNEIQNVGAEMSRISWSSFFQPRGGGGGL